MDQDKSPNSLPDNIDILVLIDKEKLPEDVIKILEENLPKELQEKVIKMLGQDKSSNTEDKLFAIQTGTVVGNIYKDELRK